MAMTATGLISMYIIPGLVALILYFGLLRWLFDLTAIQLVVTVVMLFLVSYITGLLLEIILACQALESFPDPGLPEKLHM